MAFPTHRAIGQSAHGVVGVTPVAAHLHEQATGLKRASLVSVMYSEELDSSKSSVTLQRTDRHGILGQKPADFQVSL